MIPSLPWWLWPNLLALDAPFVAIVWQRFLGCHFAVPVPWAATSALAAAVWAIFLIDRWLDSRRGEFDADRHRFAACHPHAFALVAAIAAIAGLTVACSLSISYWRAGGIVTLGVTVYLGLVHAGGGLLRVGGAKELLVAIGFASGVAIPLATAGRPLNDWLPSVGAFLGLCLLNCRLIEWWESKQALAWPRPELLLSLALLAAATALPTVMGSAIAVAVVTLFIIHFGLRRRPRVARVLADAALLSPLALGGWS
jgi:hypothetical protein